MSGDCLAGFIPNFYAGDRNVSLLDVSIDSGTNMTTNAVSLKLEFWESSAPVWFTETEAQFGEIITNITKYYYVVSATGVSH